jgi:hypothetical protein
MRIGLSATDQEVSAVEEAVMPFKSKAQRRKFAELLVAGKISDQTFEEWNRSTGTARLPERVKPKAKAKSRSKSKTATRRKAR